MTYQTLLEKNNFIYGTHFTVIDNEIVPLEIEVDEDEEIIIPAIKEEKNDNGEITVVGVPESTKVITNKVKKLAVLPSYENLLTLDGEKDFRVCLKCIYYITGYNKSKNYTTDQIKTIISSFTNIDYALKNNMPKTAKILLMNIETNDLISSELKNILLNILAEY